MRVCGSGPTRRFKSCACSSTLGAISLILANHNADGGLTTPLSFDDRCSMLGNLRISYKLLMMIGFSVLGIAAVAGLGLSALWDNLLEDRKAKLRDVVSVGRLALEFNVQASRQAGLSEAEAMERGKALIRSLRYGKDDYFFAANQQGVTVASANAKVEGKNLYDM